MARVAQGERKENLFLKQATRLGLLQLLNEVNALLEMELSEVQKLANFEMKDQIEGYLKELE